MYYVVINFLSYKIKAPRIDQTLTVFAKCGYDER